jgi:hypothetical protein
LEETSENKLTAVRLLMKILELSKKNIPVGELSGALFKLICAHFTKSYAKLDEEALVEMFTIMKKLLDD